MNLKLLSLTVSTLLLLSSGCIYNLESQDLGYFKPSQKVITEDDVVVDIRPVLESGGYDVYKYLTVFYVELTNNSQNPVVFGWDNFILRDTFGTQYNIFNPEIAAEILRENSGIRFYPSFSIGIGGGYHHSHFHWGSFYRPYGFYHPYYHYDHFWWPYPYYKQDDNLSWVYSQALFPGAIYPGSKVKGLIYFKKLPKEVVNIEMDFGYLLKEQDQKRVVTFQFHR